MWLLECFNNCPNEIIAYCYALMFFTIGVLLIGTIGIINNNNNNNNNSKNKYLCYQYLIVERTGNTTKIDVVIRNVGAKNKEEAIGKFILNTNDIPALEKLDIECFNLDNLMKID